MNRDIFCNDCGTYVGTIRDAKLMKGLKFICPKCLPDEEEYNNEEGLYNSNDFSNIFNSIFKKGFK